MKRKINICIISILSMILFIIYIMTASIIFKLGFSNIFFYFFLIVLLNFLLSLINPIIFLYSADEEKFVYSAIIVYSSLILNFICLCVELISNSNMYFNWPKTDCILDAIGGLFMIIILPLAIQSYSGFTLSFASLKFKTSFNEFISCLLFFIIDVILLRICNIELMGYIYISSVLLIISSVLIIISIIRNIKKTYC